MIAEEEALAKAAVLLARHNPPGWEDFLKALAGYVDRQVWACVKAPVEQLQNAQGRAQGMEAFTRVLLDARKTVELIDKRAASQR